VSGNQNKARGTEGGAEPAGLVRWQKGENGTGSASEGKWGENVPRKVFFKNTKQSADTSLAKKRMSGNSWGPTERQDSWDIEETEDARRGKGEGESNRGIKCKKGVCRGGS